MQNSCLDNYEESPKYFFPPNFFGYGIKGELGASEVVIKGGEGFRWESPLLRKWKME